MTGSSLEALTGGWEAFPDVREWSGGCSGFSGVVERPTRMCRSGR